MWRLILLLFCFAFLILLTTNDVFAEKSTNASKAKPTENKMEALKTIIFQNTVEPKEQAFTILIPKGWKIEGGILRVDPTMQGGPAQSIAAKVDFTVKRDDIGSVMIRWLPTILYYDIRNTPAGQMGLFPMGSNYNGMLVYPLMSAQEFLTKIVFPYLHPQVNNPKLIEQRSLPKLVEKYQQLLRLTQTPFNLNYDAGMIIVTYEENGIQYKEGLITVIEDMSPLGAAIWDNKESFFFRAPIDEFDQWEPVISIIQGSVKINPQWLAGEIRGQIQRGEIALNTQRYIQDLDKQIVEHRQNTNSEINKEMFLTLTSQDEYVNPYTKEIELGSNEWKNRWVSQSGDVIYSNDTNYNPNLDKQTGRTDFKLSPAKER